MRRQFHRSKRKLLSPVAWKARLALWGGALLVGLVATGFAVASDGANGIFLALIDVSPWLALAVAPAGLMLATWLTIRFFPGAEGSGIPQTLASLEARPGEGLRSAVLSMRVAVGKILLALLGLCSGASIGREGPTVHIGAAIMFTMGRVVRFPPHYMERALIMAGGAAGVGAAFNTPLAGVVFAIEEIARSFEERTNGIVLTGVIFAGLVSMALLGNYHYFGSTSATLDRLGDWVVVPVCGVLGGFLGGAFSQFLISGSRRLAGFHRRHPLWVAGLCGLAVAAIGLYSGNLTYGTGYHEAKQAVTQGEALSPGYPFLKMAATIASYLSGIPGGIFAPSLATGAGLGADLAAWFPDTPAGAVIILGMVGYFTGVVQTPLTAFVIVMEMTDNPSMLLPLMATAFIADGVSKIICPEPIYRVLARAFVPAAKARPETAEPTSSRENP